MVRPGRDSLHGEIKVDDETFVGGFETDVSADSLMVIVRSTVEPTGRRSRPTAGGLFQPDRRWLPPLGDGDQLQPQSRPRRHAARPHRGRLVAQAMDHGHPAGRHPAPASRLLPQRVLLPLQPPELESPRHAVLSPRPVGRLCCFGTQAIVNPDDPGTLNRYPWEATGVKCIPSLKDTDVCAVKPLGCNGRGCVVGAALSSTSCRLGT